MGPLFAFVAGSGCPFCCPPAWFELLLDIFVYCFGVDDGFTLLSTGLDNFNDNVISADVHASGMVVIRFHWLLCACFMQMERKTPWPNR